MDDDEGARYRSARLIRTECSNIANQGHLMGYQAAEIEEYIFLATLDLVTSEVCRELDMKTFPVAGAQTGEKLPPMHPNCLSTTMPNMSADTLARIKRAARDPVTGKYMTVPGDMSYREWYAKYVEGNKQAVAWENHAKIIVENAESQHGTGFTMSVNDGILSEEDLYALNQYKSSRVAYPLNSVLRGEAPMTEEYRQIVRNIDRALLKLPTYEGTVYRSLSSGPMVDIEAFWKKYTPGSLIVEGAYTSSSTEIYDESMEILMVIQSKRGHDMREINPSEQEILFKRGSMFFVEKREGNTIWLTEI